MNFPSKVKIVEVGPRDGLQNEKEIIATADKVAFINLLSETGLSVIEATSFVSPKWIPQLADAKEVCASIKKNPHSRYPVLIPNLKGLNDALAVGVEDIAVFTTPSETFSQKNTNCSVAESMQRIKEIIYTAISNNIRVRAYISCVLGCPYEGEIEKEKVSLQAQQLLEMGCSEISLGDTIGVGTPFQAQKLVETVAARVPIQQLAVHFHDTYGQALANIYAVLSLGIAIVDSAVAGLGGCPYAKGASGNVATEDVLYMLQGMNIETGVNLKRLMLASRFISQKLGREPQSKVARIDSGLFS